MGRRVTSRVYVVPRAFRISKRGFVISLCFSWSGVFQCCAWIALDFASSPRLGDRLSFQIRPRFGDLGSRAVPLAAELD
jgi:hypothetical protein